MRFSAPFLNPPGDLTYCCCVFRVGRPAFGPSVVGITVKGACRVKFNTVSDAYLIC